MTTEKDDLFANLDLAKKKKTKGIARKQSPCNNNKGDSSNKIIEMPYTEIDGVFETAMKQLINQSKITLNHLYKWFTQKPGYNIFYSFYEKEELGFDRFMLWCIALGVFPEIHFKKFNWEEHPELVDFYINRKKNKKEFLKQKKLNKQANDK